MRSSILPFYFFFTSYSVAIAKRQSLHILALGDSLTAGYYHGGQAFHPYTKYLNHLFELAEIPVKIDNQGWSGERVLSHMVNRLRTILAKDASYDWVFILAGTNDIGHRVPAEKIFKEGLQPMYEMCLNQPGAKIKLAVMTVIENWMNKPEAESDSNRQLLNAMIRDYAAHSNNQDRLCLVDLDKDIPYHSINNNKKRKKIWDDGVHLTPAGYDLMGALVFDAISTKLSSSHLSNTSKIRAVST